LRPHLEYASVVWANCTPYKMESLDKLQYEAARTVTGLTSSVHLNNLIKEIRWVSLSDRRLIQKLIIVYKARHNLLPEYTQALFPPLVGNRNRNNNNFVTVTRRTQLYSYLLFRQLYQNGTI